VDPIDPPELPTQDESPAETPQTADPSAERPEQKSSVGDYVRELQREYDEQQEEGKIDLADTD
jgi:hypothetical protein